jgi:hypothetical protein
MDKLEEIKVQLIDLNDGSATIDECAERILSLFGVSGAVCDSDCHQIDLETYGVCHCCGMRI